MRRLNTGGPLAYYAAESVGAHRAARNTFQMLAFVAVGAMLLGGLASLWLARALATPIDQLSQRLRQIADSRDFSQKIPRTGTSLELDAFTDTFNQMVTSLQAAEAQTELAYVGAIKALAAALDARDTYTAGHSERVSALSVMIGRQLGLDRAQLDVLRLGALLHDIGKIGVADRVLQKNGPLTQEEFEIIKAHPALGAHILRQISFLTPHIPIVELHHERPDGRGYPQGLLGHATPLLARIVHVADAFDAMTTARAYRPAQTPTHAIAELWRYAGSQFDAEVVEAFVAAWSSAVPVRRRAHRRRVGARKGQRSGVRTRRIAPRVEPVTPPDPWGLGPAATGAETVLPSGDGESPRNHASSFVCRESVVRGHRGRA